MNRSITLLGLAVLLSGIGLMASPDALTGVESVTPFLEIGVFVMPVGISVILWGASSPDPTVTTVSGVFGNPDENELRRSEGGTRRNFDVRYLPGPKESVNCRQCYTLIPWNVAACPRCGRKRECRACGKTLYFMSGGIRCLPCVREETFCNCPKVGRSHPTRAPGGVR
ncbi:MAG: hypothetical protein L3K17_08550 [Thermoplasmata archaeon]|nr:hypothetical protein [Thermoplasmata archaeon]